MKKLLLPLFLLVVALWGSPTIHDITFVGDKHTNDETLFEILGPYDTLTYTPENMALLEARLMESDLFSSVTITPSFLSEEEVQLFIKAEEIPRWTLSDIGLSYFNNRYGEETLWFHFNAGVTNRNFLGKGQELNLYGGLWRSRYIGAKWTIPFYEKEYLLTIDTRLGHYPSLSRNYNVAPALDISGYFGKQLTKKHLLEVGLAPSLRVYEIAIDTLAVDYPEETTFQLYTSARYTLDLRDSRFTPTKGVVWYNHLTTNALVPYSTPEGDKKDFFHINSQLRGYLPAGKRNSFALRSDLLITPAGEHSFFEQLYMGGVTTVRGFIDNSIGAPVDSTPFYNSSTFNNRFLASAEFRFLLFAPRPINLSALSWYHSSMKAFPFQVHGAVFVDAGYLWEDMENLFTWDDSNLYKTAASSGFGLRFVFPSIEMKGGADLAWMIANPEEGAALRKTPIFHLYLGYPF